MRYQPTDRPDRGHVGERWSRYQLRSMQIILQATHGIVSGDPGFFKRAFGDTFADFERILMLPHDFIFNRDWYENGDPEGRLGTFQDQYRQLDHSDRAELLALLSSCDPREFVSLPERATLPRVKRVLPFYEPLSKEALAEVWAKQRAAKAKLAAAITLPEDERVEDAGLDYEDAASPGNAKSEKKERVAA